MYQCPFISTTISHSQHGSGVAEENYLMASKKGEKNVAGVPVGQRINHLTCDDDISTIVHPYVAGWSRLALEGECVCC